MAALGWIDGQNLTSVDRWLENRPDRLPGIVAGLLADKVDLLVTAGGLVTKGAMAAAPGFPIVMVGVGDPIGFGFAQSLARPGGSVTGVSNSAVDLAAKRLQLLLEIYPGARRIAVLADSNDPALDLSWRQPRDAATQLGLTPLLVSVGTAADLETEIPRLAERTDVLLISFNALLIANRAKIAALALASRLPTSCPIRDFVVAGGLLSLGTSLPQEFRRAVPYVDKILKGANPADLPIEQPTVFELVVNMKTATALGVDIPPTILARADEVIE